MNSKHDVASGLLQSLDFGSSIAEQDTLLESARVETSAFTDLLQDKVDLIPGTKGSGKSALFRIFVDFLPSLLLKERKVVIAHGIQKQETPFSMPSRTSLKSCPRMSLSVSGASILPRWHMNNLSKGIFTSRI